MIRESSEDYRFAMTPPTLAAGGRIEGGSVGWVRVYPDEQTCTAEQVAQAADPEALRSALGLHVHTWVDDTTYEDGDWRYVCTGCPATKTEPRGDQP